MRQVAETLNNSDVSLSYETQPGMAMPEDFNQRMMQHFRKIAELKKQRGRLGIIPGDSVADGIEIDKVSGGSAAEEAGLMPGDILVSVNERSTPDLEQLRRALGGKLKGDPVVLLIRRGTVELTIKAILQ